MARRRRRDEEPIYDDQPVDEYDEAEPVELGDVLEPYQDEDAQPPYEDDGAPVYGEMYGDYDEYADYGEAGEPDDTDAAGRFKVAMSIFNVVSILVGVATILLLAALLLSLLNWLTADIQHSMVLLQSNLQ